MLYTCDCVHFKNNRKIAPDKKWKSSFNAYASMTCMNNVCYTYSSHRTDKHANKVYNAYQACTHARNFNYHRADLPA